MIVNVSRFEKEKIIETTDEVIVEKNLKIYINDKFFANLRCSTGYEKELAIGFCVSEGILEKEDIKVIKFFDNDYSSIVQIYANKNNDLKFNMYLSSDCMHGLIPKKIIENKELHDITIEKIFVNSDLKIKREKIFDAMNNLQKNAVLWKKTGGTHISGLIYQDIKNEENFIFVEDISREATLDKIMGIGISKNINFSNAYFLTSGRIHGDFISKLARMNIPIAISHSSVTDRAINIAENCNITLIGFARGNRFTIYANKERII